MSIRIFKEKVNVFRHKFRFQSAGGSGYISPVRYAEFAFAFHHLRNIPPTSLVLDVGSFHSLLPTWLASEVKCNVICLDPWEAFIKQKEFALKMGIEKKLECVLGDGRNLPFHDKVFNVVTCISTIEHIEGKGDIMLFSEMIRVLAKDGLLLLTFPFRIPYMEHFAKEPIYRKEEKEVLHFSSRDYDLDTIKRRFLNRKEVKEVEFKVFQIKPELNVFKSCLFPLRSLSELISGLLCTETDITSIRRYSRYVGCLLLRKCL